MVKLIKLNAPIQQKPLEDTKAQFTAYFNEDIILKPFSKIALRNIQFSSPNVDSIVAGQGLKVSLKDNLDGSKNWKTILVSDKTYVEEQLGFEIYKLLNSAFLISDCPLIRTGIHNRVMFDVGYTDKNVMHIDFKFTEDNYNAGLSTNSNISYNDTTLVYSKNANFGEWDYVNTGKIPLSLGTGVTQFVMEGAQDGCAIAIYPGLFTPDDPDDQPDDVDFYLKVYTEGGTYWYKKSLEEAVNSGFNVVNLDTVHIFIQQGNFVVAITRPGGVGPTITIVTTPIEYADFNEDVDVDVLTQEKLEYYGFFGLKNETSSFKDIRWTPNPYFSSDENGIVKTPQPTPHVVINSLSDAVPSTVSLDFLQGFNYEIGFNSVYYQLTGVSGSFIGDLTTTDLRLPDGFYVVLDNIRLNSYDFNTTQRSGNGTQPMGRRKNILANITSFDLLTTYNIISYETDAPTFIDIDNKDPITLNSISVSVYDNDNNLLSVGSPDVELTTTLTKCPLKLTLLVD